MDGCQIDEFAPSTSGAPRKVPSLGLSSQRKTAHLLAGMCSAEGFGDEAVRRSASPQFTNQWLPSQSAPNILNSKEANETVRCPEPCSSTLHLARLNDADENATLDSAQERVYDATQSFVAGEAVDSSSERNTTTESDSTQRTPPVHTTPARFFVSVMAASACAGLLLVAIAAIGTTYTYNVMLASRLEALHKLTSTASKENNESSTDLSENRTNFDIFNPFNNSEDDYLVKRRVRGRSSWNLKQRWAGKQKTSSKTTAAGPSSHQLWCFVRREALASSQYGFGRLPLGLCSVIVYQSVIITFKDIRVDLASQDIDFDERRGGMKKLASLKRLNPSIQVYVQLGEPDQPPMLHSADQKRKRDSPNGVLQALLTASDAVLQDFATGVSLWISSRHLDGLAVDLRGAVLSLEPNDTGTNITTRFAHICYERLRMDDVGFVLLLPEDPVLFARYDMNALLNTGSLKLIQKSHYVSGLTKASCLSPYKAPDLSVERIVNRTLNAVPNLMSRVLLSVTFTGAFFFVDDELARNPANVTAFMQAAYHGFLPYREVCRRVLRGQWWAVTNVATDCIEAGRATEWASCFGPASGYWLVSLKGVLGGLAVFDVDGDDFDGSCGERHILLSRLQDLLA